MTRFLLLGALLVPWAFASAPAAARTAPDGSARGLRKVVAFGDFSPFKANETVRGIPGIHAVNNRDAVAFVVHLGGLIQGLWVREGPLLREVARTGGAAPGGGQFGSFFNVDMNDDGVVVFEAGILGGDSDYGIFLHDGAPRAVARKGELGLQAVLVPRINNARHVVFNGVVDGPGPHVYRWFDGVITMGIAAEAFMPGDPHKPISIGYPRIDPAGNIYAAAEVAGRYAQDEGDAVHNAILKAAPGGPPIRVSTASIDTPSRNYNTEYTAPAVNALGDIIWGGDALDAQGFPTKALWISRAGGPPQALIYPDMPVTGSPGVAPHLVPPPQAINYHGTIVLSNYDHSAIVRYHAGALAAFVRSGDPTPEGGVFGKVHSPALNDNGCIAFVGDVVGGSTPQALWFCAEETPEVDLDVDSDNNDGLEKPARSAHEDEIEAQGPGKDVLINDFDKDSDRVFDFADDDNPFERFTPMVLQVPSSVDLNVARFRFTYAASDPAEVTTREDVLYGTVHVPGPGSLRIWTSDGSPVRRAKPDQDFNPPKRFVPSGAELGFADLELRDFTHTLYLEAVGAELVLTSVKVEVDPDGPGPHAWTMQDVVNVRTVKVPAQGPLRINGVQSLSHAESGWSMKYEITATDGLAVSDVRLKDRVLAPRMSLPYGVLDLDGRDPETFELTPSPAGEGTYKSRYVYFRKAEYDDRVHLLCIYAVDAPPVGLRACLLVSQLFEFVKMDPGENVEPSFRVREMVPPSLYPIIARLPLRAARFRPMVSFSARTDGDFIPEAVELPMRLHFRSDGAEKGNMMFLRDADTPLEFAPLPPYLVYKGQNPLQQEDKIWAFVLTAKGDADNFHFTDQAHIDEPEIPPGCPECVHMHWRWGAFLRFPDGLPLTPRPQAAEVGVTLAKADEVDPAAMNPRKKWQDLVNGEGIAPADQVFWYEGSTRPLALQWADRRDNLFLKHGGYYAPNRPAHLHPRPPRKVGQEQGTGPAPVFAPGEPVVLSGEFHPGGPGLAYQVAWEFGDGISRDFLPVAGTDDEVQHAYAAPGDYTAYMIVMDEDGIWKSAPVAVRVASAPNGLPVADAGPDQVVEQTSHAGALVTLDASGSGDPDGDALTYVWSGPFGGAAGAAVQLVLPLGATEVTLTVDDGKGGTSTDVVRVEVRDTKAPVFTFVPGPLTVERTSEAGAQVSLGAAVLDVCDASPLVVDDAPAVFPPGTTVVTFRAVDASGNAATAQASVTVVDTQGPVVQAATASPSQIAAEPVGRRPDTLVPVTLSVTAVDPSGGIEVRLVSVASSDDASSRRDRTSPDAVITGPLTALLRAEFDPRHRRRVYTLTFECRDAAGNVTTGSVDVVAGRF